MDEKKGFVFYRSFYEAISKISNKETKADIFEAICELGLNDNVVTLDDSIGQIIMDLIAPQLQANNKKYEDGRKGGRPKKTTGYENEKTTGYENKKPKVKEKDKEKEKEKVKDKDIFISTNTTNKNNIFVLVEKEFGRTLSSTEIDKLTKLEDEHGFEKMKLAVEECCLNNIKTLAYLNGILKNWKDKPIEEIQNGKRIEKEVCEEEIEIADYDWLEGL